ncbi:MAG: diacylglycerol kinase family protein [Sphingomonas bacterium]
MVCCTIIAALLGLLMRPVLALRKTPLAWRPGVAASQGSQPIRAAGRVQSFAHALAGLRFLVRNEPNMRIHIGAGVAAMLAGAVLHIGVAEWRWLVLAVMLMLAAEALNTAIEQTCNAIGLSYNPAIKAAKDVAAGAVLIAAIAAALIGASIFGPYLVGVNPGPAQPFHHFICGR